MPKLWSTYDGPLGLQSILHLVLFVQNCKIVQDSVRKFAFSASEVTTLWRYTNTFITHTHTHTHPFNNPFSGTIQVSQYQKGKTSLDFTEARDSEWQWHQLGRKSAPRSILITTPAPHHFIIVIIILLLAYNILNRNLITS